MVIEGIFVKIALAILREATTQEVRTAIRAFQIVSAVGRLANSRVEVSSDCSEMDVFDVEQVFGGLPEQLVDRLFRQRTVSTRVMVEPEALVVENSLGVRQLLTARAEPLVGRFTALQFPTIERERPIKPELPQRRFPTM